MKTKDLHFSYNWNGKLNCQCFTTLRLYNAEKYKTGALFNIYLNNKPKGQARLIQMNYFNLKDVNEFVARIDTGLSAKECQNMIRQMYKNCPTINWNNQFISFCLFQYVDNNNQASINF